MLGLADGITWAAGAGGNWRVLIDPLVHRVVELRPKRDVAHELPTIKREPRGVVGIRRSTHG